MAEQVPELLLAMARRRVAKGVEWFNKQAEYDMRFRGWRLQMMSIIGGKVHSHVRVAYNTDNPLALVLKWESDLASPFDGRVTWATVANAFGFVGRQGSLKAQFLGFFEGNAYTSSWTDRNDPMRMLYSQALDQAWAEALGEYHTRTAPHVYRWKEQEPIKSPGVLSQIRDAFFGGRSPKVA